MVENKEIMAKNIQYYMDRNGIDRTKLCDDLNFKYTTVTDWLNAKTYPRIDKIEIMARYFGISKADLVEDRNSRKLYDKRLDYLARIVIDDDMYELVIEVDKAPKDVRNNILQILRAYSNKKED